MKLKLLTPVEIVIDEEVNKVIAEAENGFFCLLPRHVDFVTALVPGILFYTGQDGEERLVAVDEGTLVKCGAEIMLSTRHAVCGDDLRSLSSVVERVFLDLDERERQARSALARLEASTVRRILQVEEGLHG